MPGVGRHPEGVAHAGKRSSLHGALPDGQVAVTQWAEWVRAAPGVPDIPWLQSGHSVKVLVWNELAGGSPSCRTLGGALGSQCRPRHAHQDALSPALNPPFRLKEAQ